MKRNKQTRGMKTISLSVTAIIGVVLLIGWGLAAAQDDQPPAGEAAPPADAAATIAPESFPQLLNLNLEWINSDLCRLVEELRRAYDPWEKREVIEQIEFIIYKHVEYPLVFKQAEVSDALDFERIGTTSDVVDAGSANPLAPLVAEALALYGIAKGYEGFAAAANDQITRAKQIYPQVESLTVKIDNFQDRKTIKTWLSDTMGNWASTNAVRVTFHGKNMLQDTVEDLSRENVSFSATNGNIAAYYLAVAQRDYLRGMKRYLITNDRLTERRPNEFNIYLPPGTYQLKMETTAQIPAEIKVDADPDNNHFIVESLENGVTCYPRPKVQPGGENGNGANKKKKKKTESSEEEGN